MTDDELFAWAHNPLGVVLTHEALVAVVRVLGELKALKAALHPPGKYGCGCPAVRSDKVKLFCSTHYKSLAPVAEEGVT